MIEATAERQRNGAIAAMPDLANELYEVVFDPPDQTFAETATVEVEPGGRSVELRYLGRGHTDNDIVVIVPDADVLFAGDLLEADATPYFGDAYPIDWPATVESARRAGDAARSCRATGPSATEAFAVRQLGEFREVAELARLVDARAARHRRRRPADALHGRHGARAADAGARPDCGASSTDRCAARAIL